MATKLVIAGVFGRMGQRILALASQDASFEVIGGLVEPGDSRIGHTLHGTQAKATDDPTFIAQGDVLIDFTVPAATLTHIQMARVSRKPMVIGTTGLGSKELKAMQKAAGDIAIVQSPNMSLGMNVLFKLVNLAAKALPGYDIEIIEAHHRQKNDAPSGSALKLGESVAQALGRDLSKDVVHGRKGAQALRGPKEIGFHAIRGGDIVGDHTVMIAGLGERLELTHRAHSRDTFAAGALQAAKWIVNQPAGAYTMQDVLGLNA